MVSAEKKNIGSPDETRTFDKGHLDVVNIGDMVFGRATFEPGWKWSECIKPIAGTETCQVHHNGYVESGQLHIVMDDGAEFDVGPGDAFVCPPGHDAWTVGGEACIAYDFAPGVQGYAKS